MLLRFYSSSLISPLNATFNLRPATSNVILAGKFSFPLMFPSETARATAFSISFCELTPTIFRNFLMLRLKTSSFIVRSRDRVKSNALRKPATVSGYHATRFKDKVSAIFAHFYHGRFAHLRLYIVHITSCAGLMKCLAFYVMHVRINNLIFPAKNFSLKLGSDLALARHLF